MKVKEVNTISTISRVTTWSDNQVLTAAALNGEFNNIVNDYNGSITNANISASAAIATSKINATFPSGAILGTTDTQTLTNKTLTTPVLSKPTIDASIQGTASYTPSASGTATLTLATDNVHLITMPAGNITIALDSASAGQFFFVRVLQDSGGSRTVTWFSTITWAGASAPTLTTTASRADLFAFFAKTATTFDGFICGQNIG